MRTHRLRVHPRRRARRRTQWGVGEQPLGGAKKQGVSGTISIIAKSGPAPSRSRSRPCSSRSRRPTRTSRSTTRERATTLLRSSRPRWPAGTRPTSRRFRSQGSMKQFAQSGKLKPITFARGIVGEELRGGLDQDRDGQREALRSVLQGVEQVDGLVQRQGVQERGRDRPEDLAEVRCNGAKTLRASGIAPYSIGGADGWTLTDLFENIYLRTAGGGEVRPLAAHKIKWTDPSVKDGTEDDGAGLRRRGQHRRRYRRARFRPTSRPRSTTSVVDRRRRAMVIEARLRPGVAITNRR